MNNSLLYVEPIYIQSEDEKTAIPELRRVVIGYENEVVWGETLEEALVKMFGQGTGGQTTTATRATDDIGAAHTGTDQTSLQGLIEQANRYFNAGQDARRIGDWAEYGRYQRLLEETLGQLEGNIRE